VETIKPVCGICGNKMSFDDNIFMCANCRLDPKLLFFYTRILQAASLFSLGFELKDIQTIDCKLYHFLKHKGFSRCGLLMNKLFFFSQPPSEMDERLRSYFLSNNFALKNMPKDLIKYFKLRYGNKKTFKKQSGLNVDGLNWRGWISDAGKIFGCDINYVNLSELNPEIIRFIRNKRGMNLLNACDIAGIKDKKWSRWTIKKLVDLSLELISGMDDPEKFSIYGMAKKYGARVIRIIRRYFGDDQIGYAESIKRMHKRERLRAAGIRVEDHENLVREIIKKKFHFYLSDDFLYNEALQAGKEGLLKAAGKYDPLRASWSTYAWTWCEAAIRRHFENFNPTSVIRVPCHKQYDENFDKTSSATLSLNVMMNDDPTSAEIIESIDCGVDVEKMVLMGSLRDMLLKKFGNETTNMFFDHFMFGAKYKSKIHTIEEVKEYVKNEFF
jgi:DNA-directed RNA polymerase sigma subunit (sigma70/sigma32)